MYLNRKYTSNKTRTTLHPAHTLQRAHSRSAYAALGSWSGRTTPPVAATDRRNADNCRPRTVPPDCQPNEPGSADVCIRFALCARVLCRLTNENIIKIQIMI